MLAFLLAAQAAGMTMDYFGTLESDQMAKNMAELKRREIEKQIMYSRIATADESLRAMVGLRKNLGSQMAMFAARGAAPGPTTALFSTESVSNFGADERVRKINQMATESQLRAEMKLSKMQEDTFSNDLWNSFIKRSINRIPTSPEAWSQIGQGFGLNKVGSK